MWRTLFILVAGALPFSNTLVTMPTEGSDETGERPVACSELGERLAELWPRPEPTFCSRAAALGLSEVRPGIAVGRSGTTVTVLADRSLVGYRAVEGAPRRASSVAGDVVVNANWHTAAGSLGPIVVGGALAGSADTVERGQIVAVDSDCSGRGTELRHVWTGEIYQHVPCTVAAVSGVSLVHKGQRADAYPGIDITTGYTNVNRSHSFLGFNDRELVVIATAEMNASALADYALSLGVHEGVMLDGGRSTQISTPTASLHSTRSVPAFAVLDSRH